MMTLESRDLSGAQSFGGAYKCKVCVHVFIETSVCACCENLCSTVYNS
jgi:hypothetical protein